MPRLILIRHACILGNPQRMSGWTDTALSEQGCRQVAALAASIRFEPAFDAIFCSPLQRARDTVVALAGRCASPIIYAEDLKEIFCGEVDGVPIAHVQQCHPQFWAANNAQVDPDFRWPGGESYREFRARCLGAIQRIASVHAQRIAIVTHAGFINQIVGLLCGLSAAQWEPFRPDNVSITEVDWRGPSGTLVSFNRRAGDRAALP